MIACDGDASAEERRTAVQKQENRFIRKDEPRRRYFVNRVA